jgi:hypothetical protein
MARLRYRALYRIWTNGLRIPGRQEVKKFGAGETGRASDCSRASVRSAKFSIWSDPRPKRVYRSHGVH